MPADSIPTSCSEVLEVVVIQSDVHEAAPPACEDIAVSTKDGIPNDIETEISVPLEEPIVAIEPVATASLSTSSKILPTNYTKKNQITSL